jgi:hypothetical protein
MKRLGFCVIAAVALWAAACSSGGSSVKPPPPTGNFSLASLNGTYAFITSGEVFTGGLSATPLSRVGSFTADGRGGITGGIEDVNSAGTTSLALQITGGSYTVSADGRGTLTLTVGSSSINFGITLTSTNEGLMIDETSSTSQSSTGSGNFIKQTGGPFTVGSASGTYVFDFAGLDASQFPDSIVGEFSVSNGVVSNGVQDENDDGNLPATPTPVSFIGTMATDPLNLSSLGTNGRGIAQLNGIQYVFYLVDGTRIRFLSTSSGMVSGDGVLQPSAPTSISGGFAFIVAGTSGSGGVTRIGRFTASGASVTNVLMDTNNAATFTQTNSGTNASVTMDQANPGRGVVTFKDPNLSVPFTFVFYLSSASSGVIQDQSQSATKGATDVADGSIVAQSGSPFSSSNVSGPYALNWSGLSVQQGGTFATQDEEDLLAQANIMNLTLSGTADIFQFTNGIPRTDFGLGGKITLGGDGTGGGGQRNSMTINLNGASAINFVVYIANPQLAFFANSNNSGTQRIVAGILKMQQ